MAQYKRPTIADREDEYRAKRRQMIISPERQDAFAGGWIFFHLNFSFFFLELLGGKASFFN